MNKLLVAAALLGLSATGASAAGLAQPEPAMTSSQIVSGRDWSGFYAGVDLGGASEHITATDVTEPNGGFFTDLVPAGTEGFDFDPSGIAGGVHAGRQYQWQQLVLGAEVSLNATTAKQSIISPYFPDSDVLTGTIGSYATAVGRIGYTFDRFLVYGKAGFAAGQVGFRARDNDALVTYQQNNWQGGFAIGAGIDYAMTDTVSLGLDYTHVNLGSATSTGPNVFDSGALGNNPETFRTSATADVVMARLSYRFGN